jgi:hypothetical protein
VSFCEPKIKKDAQKLGLDSEAHKRPASSQISEITGWPGARLFSICPKKPLELRIYQVEIHQFATETDSSGSLRRIVTSV